MKRLLVMGVVALAVLAACGDDTPEWNDVRNLEPGDPTGEPIPDPCALVSSDALSIALGSEQGVGDLQAADPTERQVCLYETGTRLLVEDGANYESAVADLREQSAGSTIEDVPGVGDAAVWQDAGEAGQLLALDGDYFIAVALETGGAGGKTAALAIAEAMLAAT
jgi:hypothetical protein